MLLLKFTLALNRNEYLKLAIPNLILEIFKYI